MASLPFPAVCCGISVRIGQCPPQPPLGCSVAGSPLVISVSVATAKSGSKDTRARLAAGGLRRQGLRSQEWPAARGQGLARARGACATRPRGAHGLRPSPDIVNHLVADATLGRAAPKARPRWPAGYGAHVVCVRVPCGSCACPRPRSLQRAGPTGARTRSGAWVLRASWASRLSGVRPGQPAPLAARPCHTGSLPEAKGASRTGRRALGCAGAARSLCMRPPPPRAGQLRGGTVGGVFTQCTRRGRRRPSGRRKITDALLPTKPRAASRHGAGRGSASSTTRAGSA